MRELKKRMFSFMICMVMVLTTVNLPAFTLSAKADDEWVEVSTYDDLKKELVNGVKAEKKIRLKGDISKDIGSTDSDTIQIKGSINGLVLDLNGYSIRYYVKESRGSAIPSLFYIEESSFQIINSGQKESNIILENIYEENTNKVLYPTIFYVSVNSDFTIGSSNTNKIVCDVRNFKDSPQIIYSYYDGVGIEGRNDINISIYDNVQLGSPYTKTLLVLIHLYIRCLKNTVVN